jgi:hypothetical protein
MLPSLASGQFDDSYSSDVPNFGRINEEATTKVAQVASVNSAFRVVKMEKTTSIVESLNMRNPNLSLEIVGSQPQNQ